MMKKAAALLLAACLALQPATGIVQPVYGAAEHALQIQTGESTQSILEAEIVSTLSFPYSGNVTVSIRNGKGLEQKKELTLEKGKSARAEFPVPAGQYTVMVRADKFAEYVQTVDVEKGWTHRIRICSSQTESQGSTKPGWIRPGDVNGDGTIDKTDAEALAAAVREDQESAAMDLNNDGRADLADLNSLVQSMGEKQESSVEKLWIPDTVQPDEGTAVENMNALFEDEGITRLQKKEISKDSPAGITLTMAKDGTQAPVLGGMVIRTAAEVNEDGTVSSQIASGTVTFRTADGRETELPFETASETSAVRSLGRNGTSVKEGTARLLAGSASVKEGTARLLAGSASVKEEADGSLVLDFGGQTAVKSVSIRITGTKKNQPFVEIAKVEFLNDMESRIAPPQLDIPSITSVKPGSKELTAEWSPQTNVTGYELYVEGPVKNQSSPVSQIITADQTSCSISSIQNKSLVNYKEYRIKVRSVNGSWRSPWSEEKTAVPRPQAKPAKPDNVRAEGGYRSITVSWKDMDDSDGYMVYYKEEGGQFQPVARGFKQTAEGTGRLKENRYEITGLKDHVSYSVYVVSWNEMGWSGQSLTAVAKTKSVDPPKLPAYRLLNSSDREGELTAHIKDAVIGGSSSGMKGSPLDEGKENSALGLVDNDYGSYWSKLDWDDGVAYPAASKGMTVTLDDDYEMNYFTFAAADQKGSLDQVKIEYWDLADEKNAKNVGARLLEKKDVNDNPYYIVKFDQTVTANRIRMCLGRSWSDKTEMRVGEIRFYQYDSLEDDIMGLYTDDMHTTLRPNVTASVVQELKNRLETEDERSGEKHPLYQELALELKTAEEILNSDLEPSIQVNPEITAKKDTHLGFGGLNAWQPLGKSAYAGDTLLVYVGHPTKRTGEAADLQLVFTQYHAEAASVSRSIGLRIGRNEITVPQLSTLAFERGGQLYAAYTGNSASDQYAVRISGGNSIPVLNIYGKSGEEKKKAVREYITALEAHTASLKDRHEESHSGKNQAGEYDQKNCILNATDIMMEQMMYSLPAEQVLAGLDSAQGLEQKAEKLERALDAMEQMMTLFYQHKGLSSSAGTKYGNNALPSQHLNIRYMRMFAGAFMYASGNHIGIEWGSAQLASAVNGWNGFGWGIAHEIGHNINQSCYAVAEITNNYFAQLMKSINEKGATRFQYENVYKKVTSNTLGRSSNGATQLAMYWQLYLAFGGSTDDGHIYDSYDEQFENLFFARTDTYARNPDKAPNGGVKLTGDTDQNLMRLACAAAGKNILAFFRRWGMEPDEETAAYAEKFQDEKKAVYYVNEECRKYRLSHPDEADTIKGEDVLSAEVSAQSDQVTVTIHPGEDVEKDVILGYEIIRSMTRNGTEESAVAGFQPAAEDGTAVFTDHIYAVNNRVMSYQVRAVDKFLNYSNTEDAGSVKIETDGVLDKSQWTVQTDMASVDDKEIQGDEQDPDSGYDGSDPKNVQQAKVNSAERIIDLKETAEGTYNGTVKDDKTPASVTIDMHKTEAVTALKYKGSALPSVTVEISSDGTEWKAVRTDYKGLADAQQTDWETVWFDAADESAKDHWIGTYDARYVRIRISGASQVSVCEIDICGPSGDNVEFFERTDSRPAVGILKEDYKYADEGTHVIPKDSLIFAGTYKGNPAYNAVVIYDTQGNVIGAKNGKVQAEQLIFAKVPEHGELGETSDGTWVYYVEPGNWDKESIRQISGVRCELFRFDGAESLEGERIVSDTKIMEMPDSLPEISLKGESE